MSAYFQDGSPIYSAEAIRFRVGYPRYNRTLESAIAHCITSSNMVVDETQFVWSYTSPHYQMFQVSCSMKIQVLHILFHPFKLLNGKKS